MRGLRLLLVGLALGLAPAFAASGGAPSDADFKASQQYLNDAIAKKGNKPPVLTDPEAAPHIRAAFDVRMLDGTASLTLDQASPLCIPSITALYGYILWGQDESALDHPTSAQTMAIGFNMLAYQDEIALGINYSIACGDLLLASTSRSWDAVGDAGRTATLRDAVHEMRGGMAGVLSGMIQMQVTPLKPENLTLTLDTAVAHADGLAANLGPAERAELTTALDSALASKAIDADRHAKLLKLKAAFARSDCSGLCAV